MTATHAFRKALHGALLCATLLNPPAYAQDAKAGRLYEDALRRYNAKDLDGATVQLKNALQEDRKLLPAHLLLGKVALENSNPGAAEGALLSALDLGADRSEVVVPLAHAFLGQGKHAMMLAEPRLQPEGLPPSVQVQLLLVRAAAHTDLGDERSAMKAIEAARSINVQLPDVWMAEVPLRIRAHQLDDALKLVDRALQLDPRNAEARYQRGSVLHVRGEIDRALAEYAATLQANPNHLEALIARAGIFVDRGLDDAALADIGRLRKVYPNDPRADYLNALIAERKGNRKAAAEALQRVTDLLDPAPIEYIRYRPQLLMLAGLSHHGLNQYQKARPYLEMLIKQQPRNPATKLLAQILFEAGENENAVLLLETYLRLQPNDAQALAMLASGHSAQGRTAKATQLMSQALSTRDTPEARSVLGQALLQSGKAAAAQPELENAWKRSPTTATGVSMVMLYLRTEQPTKALAVAERLVKSQPEQPSMHQLMGMAQSAAGDVKAARASFERALQFDKGLVEPQMSLARLDAQQGKFGEAKARLERLVNDNDKLVDPMLELASLHRRQRKWDEAERWLEKAVLISAARDLRPNFAQVDLLLQRGRLPEAQQAGKALLIKAPEDGYALMAYARTQLANGDTKGVRSTLTNAGRLFTGDVDAQSELARLQFTAKDFAGATYTLSKILEDQPKNVQALVLLSSIEIQSGELTKAGTRVAQLLTLRPQEARTHLLAAELALARQQPSAALVAIRRAHEVQPSTATTMRLMLHQGQFDAGNAAQVTAENWLKKHPADATVQTALAELLAARRQWPEARAAYQRLLELIPGDASALNNLALIQISLNDLPAAIRSAEAAQKSAPNEALVIDTLAWALHKSGKSERALSLLRDARLRAPEHAEIRYHLAVVLQKLGRTAEARAEVRAALESPKGLESVQEAQALASSLQ